MNDKFPIEDAPMNDGWILAYDAGRDPENRVPWALATRCDEGWREENFNPIDPTHWVPVPDPQPEPTGWMRPEKIVIQSVTTYSGGMCKPGRGYTADIFSADGSFTGVDGRPFQTIEEARDAAREIAQRWDIPIVEVDDPPPPPASATVIPFTGGRIR